MLKIGHDFKTHLYIFNVLPMDYSQLSPLSTPPLGGILFQMLPFVPSGGVTMGDNCEWPFFLSPVVISGGRWEK